MPELIAAFASNSQKIDNLELMAMPPITAHAKPRDLSNLPAVAFPVSLIL